MFLFLNVKRLCSFFFICGWVGSFGSFSTKIAIIWFETINSLESRIEFLAQSTQAAIERKTGNINIIRGENFVGPSRENFIFLVLKR